MELKKAGEIPTLDEFLDLNQNNTDPKIIAMIDDFCKVPECEINATDSHLSFFKERKRLLSEFKSRVDDIIMLNRYAMMKYNRNAQNISAHFQQFDRNHNGIFKSLLEKRNKEDIYNARQSFKNFDWYCKILESRSVANETFIVNLWVSIEKYVRLAVKVLNSENEAHRWDDLIDKMERSDIFVREMNSYELIEELRCVYKEIKRNDIADSLFLRCGGFSTQKNQSPGCINYRAHDYATGAHHFIHSIINAMGPVQNIKYDITVPDEEDEFFQDEIITSSRSPW